MATETAQKDREHKDQQGQQAAPPAPEDETFLSEEDVWAEEIARRRGDPAPEPTSQPAEASQEEPSDEDETQAKDEADRGEPDDKATEAKDSEDDGAPSWLKSLPEEARESFEAQQHSLASLRAQFDALHGRLAPVQQENARLRQRLAQQGAPAQQDPNGGDRAGQPNASTGFSLKDVPEFAEFSEAFPDEAKAIGALYERQAQEIQKLNNKLSGTEETLGSMQQTAQQHTFQSELQTLSQAHPDWQTVRNSEDFENWLSVQPESVSQLTDSSRSQDCIWLLNAYKRDYEQVHGRPYGQPGKNGRQGEPAAGEPQAEDPKASSQDAAAQQARDRRQRIRSVPSPDPQQSGVGIPTGDPGAGRSAEEVWAEEFARRKKRAQSNR